MLQPGAEAQKLAHCTPCCKASRIQAALRIPVESAAKRAGSEACRGEPAGYRASPTGTAGPGWSACCPAASPQCRRAWSGDARSVANYCADVCGILHIALQAPWLNVRSTSGHTSLQVALQTQAAMGTVIQAGRRCMHIALQVLGSMSGAKVSTQAYR